MNDSQFAGLDFALGSVRGFRSWKVTIEGKLEALHQTGLWIPGENTAECHGYPSKGQVPEIPGEDWKDRNSRAQAWKANHEMSECGHGFYAYFSAADMQIGVGPAVHGVIEGYGEVLIGTKGFRAMKARILALSIEPYQGIWNLDQFVIDKVRRNYPGVAVFDSNFAMQAEFPVDTEISEATR